MSEITSLNEQEKQLTIAVFNLIWGTEITQSIELQGGLSHEHDDYSAAKMFLDELIQHTCAMSAIEKLYSKTFSLIVGNKTVTIGKTLSELFIERAKELNKCEDLPHSYEEIKINKAVLDSLKRNMHSAMLERQSIGTAWGMNLNL